MLLKGSPKKNTRPSLTIIRGLPGSGKTEMANYLTRGGAPCMVIEPDRFLAFGGVYRYSRRRYARAVECALECVRLAAKAGCDAIYSDVLPTNKEIARIISAYALNSAYRVQPRIRVIVMPCTVKQSQMWNTHNVKPADILRMAETWEQNPDEETGCIP